MIRVTRHTDLWLVRHAQTDWNRARRYQSRSDRPLTLFGAAQSEAVAQRLERARFTVIVSSGLMRTTYLADLVAERRSGAFVTQRDDRWREADHGVWEGLTHGEVTQRYAAQMEARWADPWRSRAHGGESLADLWARVERAWCDLLRDHDGGRLLIVTHATPIQLLLCALLGLSLDRYWQFRIDLGSITNVDLYPSGAITRVINDVPQGRCREP